MDNSGELPVLDWIDIDKLTVDRSYQRSTEGGASRSLINKIAREFSWAKFQPLTVCAAGAAYNIIDGQHRREGVRKRGGIAKLPCYIVPPSSLTEQADHFIQLNKNRVKMHTVDMYHAQLAAGEEGAVLVDMVCREAGVKICKSPFCTAQMPAGQTQAVGTLQEAVKRYSKNSIVRALKTLHMAFPDLPGQMRQSIVAALLRLYSANLKEGRQINDAIIAVIIRQNPPKRMEFSAKLDEDFRSGTVAWIIAFIIGEYNKSPQIAHKLSRGGS